jgi:hypothetical protein
MTKKKTEVNERPIHEIEIRTSELAAVVGKTSRWIRQLTSEGILKQISRGKYILGDAAQQYIEHIAGGKEDNTKPRYIDEKTEHERIKKEKATLELRMLQGKLHEANDVEKIMTDMILSAKSKLKALPTRLAPELENESAAFIKKKLTTEIDAVLMSLSEYSPELFAASQEDDQDDSG